MTHIMRVLAGPLFVLLTATLAAAQGQVEPVKPEPAWCGGSYSVTGGLEPKEYVEAVKAGQTILSGTNFGACDDIVKEVRGVDGTVREVRIPTYPAAPASQVSFDADGRVLYQNGDVDKDGKAIVQELKLPEMAK
jgi:hypothetical protein